MQAIQWTGDNLSDISDAAPGVGMSATLFVSRRGKVETMNIGDYLVVESNKVSVVPQKEFEETYDPA